MAAWWLVVVRWRRSGGWWWPVVVGGGGKLEGKEGKLRKMKICGLCVCLEGKFNGSWWWMLKVVRRWPEIAQW